jgi:hypothetical protein
LVVAPAEGEVGEKGGEVGSREVELLAKREVREWAGQFVHRLLAKKKKKLQRDEGEKKKYGIAN